jgi:predicted Zn-dependent protease
VREVSGYTRTAEAEADTSAIAYLRATDYNPVGLLTFMERLHRLEERRPHLELGIFQTHPATAERIQSLIAQLQSAGVPLDRRAVTDAARAEVRPVTLRGQALTEVVVRGRVVLQPAVPWPDRSASAPQPLTPAERCQAAADRLNAQFDTGLQARQVQVVADGNDWLVTVRGEEVLRISPDDAAFHQQSGEQLARQAAEALRLALWEDFVRSTG